MCCSGKVKRVSSLQSCSKSKLVGSDWKHIREEMSYRRNLCSQEPELLKNLLGSCLNWRSQPLAWKWPLMSWRAQNKGRAEDRLLKAALCQQLLLLFGAVSTVQCQPDRTLVCCDLLAVPGGPGKPPSSSRWTLFLKVPISGPGTAAVFRTILFKTMKPLTTIFIENRFCLSLCWGK